jgi:hypothetical protein
MSYVLRTILPTAIVDHVKLYTGEGVWRKNKYINIHRICRDDPRYDMLRKRPRIRQIINDGTTYDSPFRGCAWFKLPNNKFMVITVRQGKSWHNQPSVYGYLWEMHYNNNISTVYLGL